MIRLLLALSLAAPAWAEAPLPPTPKHHFVDEVGVVSAETSNAVSSILLEHERTTSEQVVIAILKSLSGEDVSDRTLKISQAWRIGKKGKDNGMLLALYWEDRKSRIEVGYGLEGLMTDAKSNQVLSEVLAPELRAGDPNRAIVLTALEILTQLDSPIIKNGRAEELLRTGGLQRGWQPRDSSEVSRGWFVWIILGFILLSVAFNFMTAADAHFTGGGWYRPNPWRRARRGIFWGGVAGGLGGLGGGRGGWGGGGGFGGGGGGGFLGGGGSFGGGGASGSW